MFLGLAENRKKGIGIGFQEMESFPKANAQTAPPPRSCGKEKCTGGDPCIWGITAAEVGVNAKAEAGPWQPSLEGQNGERKEWKFVVTSRTFYGSNWGGDFLGKGNLRSPRILMYWASLDECLGPRDSNCRWFWDGRCWLSKIGWRPGWLELVRGRKDVLVQGLDGAVGTAEWRV